MKICFIFPIIVKKYCDINYYSLATSELRSMALKTARSSLITITLTGLTLMISNFNSTIANCKKIL